MITDGTFSQNDPNEDIDSRITSVDVDTGSECGCLLETVPVSYVRGDLRL